MKESISYKAEMFFAKNWKYIFWGLILAVILIAWELNSISSRMLSLENIVRDNNSKVVLTTADGRAMRVIKEPLKAEYLKQYAISNYINNFIVSRANITNKFSEAKFIKASDILENSPKLAYIWKNFIREDNKIAKGQFVSYLNWLINAIATDKLPEYIAIQKYNVDTYEYEDNKYKLVIDINVNTQSYIISLGKYVTAPGVIRITGEGNFDFKDSTDSNPYGMSIDGFTIDMITKGN
jgi:hypothetical protein